MTVLDTIRNMIANPKLAWYIRNLEFWDLREKFSHWRTPEFVHGCPYDLGTPEALNWLEKHHDYRHLGEPEHGPLYSVDELDSLRALLSSVLCLPDDEVEHWSDQLTLGSDEPLRALLMDLPSNLSRTVFVQYDSWGSDEVPSNHPLTLLCASLRHLHKAFGSGPNWPCFRSLRSVTVGACTDLRHPHHAYYPSSRSVGPLFMLPVIEELHLSLINASNEDENDPNPPYIFEGSSGTSTVKDLSFYCCDISLETMRSFVQACKALRTFKCVAGCPSKKEVLHTLLASYSTTLESFEIDSHETEEAWTIASEFARRKPQEHITRAATRSQNVALSGFQSLTALELQTADLESLRTDVPGKQVLQSSMEVGKIVKRAANPLPLSDILGNSMQTIQTVKITGPGYGGLGEPEILARVAMLSDFVRIKDPKGNKATLRDIHTLCVAHITSFRAYSGYHGHSSRSIHAWCGELRRVCKEVGVYLHSHPDSEGFRHTEGCRVCQNGLDGMNTVLVTKPRIPPESGEEAEP